METLEILLVEDNVSDIELTELAFHDEAANAHISVVNNGIDALDFLHKRSGYAEAPTPRIILLDLNMPHMDGKQFLEMVKADPVLKIIPVIMLTNSQSPTDIRDCYERYASCYIVKPSDGKNFSETVTKVINFWRSLSQLPETSFEARKMSRVAL